MVNDLYDGQEEAEKLVKDFAKRLAPVGRHRAAVKNNKKTMFKECLAVTSSESFAPDTMGDVVKLLSAMGKPKL